MPRKYKNNPIIEAVCEFRLSSDFKWDLTIPGLIYEKIKDDFPLKEQHKVQQQTLTGTNEGVAQEIRVSERVRLLTKDKKSFIQIGNNILSVHCIEPYPLWESFNAMIEKAYNGFLDVAKFAKLERVGIRYINRIEILYKENVDSISLNDYFEFRPELGKGLPQTMDTFILGCMLPFKSNRDSCRVKLTDAVKENPNSLAFILDIDYFLKEPEKVPPDAVLEWIRNAHEKVEGVFEGCISDRLRKIFKEEK